MRGWKQRSEGGHLPLPFRCLTLYYFFHLICLVLALGRALTLPLTNKMTKMFCQEK